MDRRARRCMTGVVILLAAMQVGQGGCCLPLLVLSLSLVEDGVSIGTNLAGVNTHGLDDHRRFKPGVLLSGTGARPSAHETSRRSARTTCCPQVAHEDTEWPLPAVPCRPPHVFFCLRFFSLMLTCHLAYRRAGFSVPWGRRLWWEVAEWRLARLEGRPVRRVEVLLAQPWFRCRTWVR